jgi:hypothetical protein
MADSPEKPIGPCQKFFPLGCLMALASAFRTGAFYRAGQIHFSGILQLVGAVAIGYVICVVADGWIFSQRRPKKARLPNTAGKMPHGSSDGDVASSSRDTITEKPANTQ